MLIGNKDDFGFEINKGEYEGETRFSLYIDGADILAAYLNGVKTTYEWRIGAIISWFEDSLDIIMKEDPYPVDVPGETAAELNANSYGFDSEDEDEEYEWYSKVFDWQKNHAWYISRDGGLIANVFFRRLGDKIEISWINEPYQHIVYDSPKGKKLVDKNTFKQAVEDLCFHYDRLRKSDWAEE